MASHLHPSQGTPKPMPFVLSWAHFFLSLTRIPDFAGRLPGHPPRCCVASVALFACEKKTGKAGKFEILGATNIFKSWLTLHHPIKTDSVSVLLALPRIGCIQPLNKAAFVFFQAEIFRPFFVQIVWYLKGVQHEFGEMINPIND